MVVVPLRSYLFIYFAASALTKVSKCKICTDTVMTATDLATFNH